MSKGLDALDRIYETSMGSVSDYEIIEQELKRLEEIDNIIGYGGGVYNANGLIAKERKVLEIIKRNRYEAIQCLAYDIYEEYIVWYNNFAKVKPPITREEFDLLKEVLL